MPEHDSAQMYCQGYTTTPQVMECRALIALQLAVRRKLSTKIVLAGDHMQMEEQLFSNQVRESS